MQHIRFNEITWYSRIATLIVFCGIVPALAFYIGIKYGITVLALEMGGKTNTVELILPQQINKNTPHK